MAIDPWVCDRCGLRHVGTVISLDIAYQWTCRACGEKHGFFQCGECDSTGYVKDAETGTARVCECRDFAVAETEGR